VGGLTVLRAIRERLPFESTVYLGDTARVPYGSRSAGTVIRYAINNARFLLEVASPKMLVVACNTASAVALEALRESLPIPVIGVIEPGARAAASEQPGGRIGVIGTRGTISSGAYRRALLAADPRLKITQAPCPLFVPLAEEGWHEDPIAESVAHRYLDPMVEAGLDALVLGCTHYPLLRHAILRAVGPRIKLIDSAEATALEVERSLSALERAAPVGTTPLHRCFVTDGPEAFDAISRRFLGSEAPAAELVDI